ncbi:MAG: acyl-CoA dehydrogenase, partial [Muribaculaceae bacterium]|nr:acyl-CoA dehydrogenase [Muribaculaceae bacterium]
SQEAYNEALSYAKDRAQFGKEIIHFPAVYDMLSRMKAKLDAGRSMLYQTARYVDIYKCLEDIARDRSLTPEERQEMKKYSRLADAFTPIAKGMNSEYANQNAYDAISVHGGSGFIMEYKCQRLYRDARIFSIYEGTTQLQVVAAVRYITNGTYLGIIKEMLEDEVSDEMKPLKARVAGLAALYEQAVNCVKEAADNDVHDFLARRLYDMTAEILMSLLIIADASRAPEMFAKSANVYVRMAEANVLAHHCYVMHFNAEDLESFRAVEPEAAEE